MDERDARWTRPIGRCASAWSSIFAILCLGTSLPASAHWEYTRWGMSVEEVRTASKGKAVANENRELDGGDFRTILSAPHASGKTRFRADFRFGNQDRRLNSVGLRALDSKTCPTIEEQLTKRYGAPETKTRYIVKWRDAAGGDAISLALLGGCVVDYQPLAAPGPKPAT